MRRGANGRTSARTILARQREAEVLEQLQRGIPFEKIAESLGYKDASGAWRAGTRALVRIPVAAAEQLRQVDSLRVEEMYRALRPGIERGDTRSIEAALRVLAHRAKLNGYLAPSRIELTGRDSSPLLPSDAEFEVMAARLDEADQLALLALLNKARGGPECTEQPPTNGTGHTDDA
jgi:hypothetical protein